MAETPSHRSSADVNIDIGISKGKIAAADTAIKTGADIAAELVQQGKPNEAAAVVKASIKISTAILTG